jgi:hypothetical protein
MSSTTLINKLQAFMRKSKIYKEIFSADSNQLLSREEKIADLKLQLSVDTATWGLSIYESDYGIKVNESKPLADRRALIKSRMRGSGTVTSTLLKTVALAFTGGQIDVGFDGKINITFTDIVGTPPNLQDFKDAIEEIKPAFLDVIYAFLYNQYEDLTAFTYGYLEAYTYEQLRSSEVT